MKIGVRIWIRDLCNFKSDSSPLRDIGPKTIYRIISQKCIGPDMFSWVRHYMAEVCAPPSALLVASAFASAEPQVENEGSKLLTNTSVEPNYYDNKT